MDKELAKALQECQQLFPKGAVIITPRVAGGFTAVITDKKRGGRGFIAYGATELEATHKLLKYIKESENK